jgi:predicted RNA-binding protein YlqC (UPF0109 family)
MRELLEHLLTPVLKHPEALSLQVIEGEDVMILEAVVHPDDRAALEDDEGRTLRSVRNVLSAAAGRRKATFDLVDEHGEASEE